MVSETPQETKDRPNIVFILADDMGYGDVGAYNPKSKIPTPNINDLAQQGMRFTDAHSPSAVCSPTRYAVLTGRYAWRTWLSRGVVGGYTPPLIEPARPTVASFLKDNGYTTAMIGKWHLGLGWVQKNGFVGTADNASDHWRGSWQDGDAENGMNVDFAQPSQGGPTALGFDYAYFTSACSTIDGPFCYIERDRPTETPDRPIFVDPDKGPDHRPRPGWIAPGFVLETVDPEFTASAIDFMKSAVAEDAERPFFVYLALSSPHAPWLPPTFVQGASEDGARGDLVVLFDWAVGEIVAALEDMGLADDTLVIVTSDNGPRIGTNGHASSGELRGCKSHAWEGGHRVPFMARWPGRIEAGTVSEEPIELTDLFATVASLIEQEVPKGAAPDSYDVSAALLGRPRDAPIREAIVSHSENGTFAIRQGPWKAIYGTDGSGGWVTPADEAPSSERSSTTSRRIRGNRGTFTESGRRSWSDCAHYWSRTRKKGAARRARFPDIATASRRMATMATGSPTTAFSSPLLGVLYDVRRAASSQCQTPSKLSRPTVTPGSSERISRKANRMPGAKHL